MDTFLIEEKDTLHVLLWALGLFIVGLLWAVIRQLREEGASLERVWHFVLALILVGGFAIPMARHLYGSAFAITLVPAGVWLEYLDPRPAQMVTYEEIEALEVCRQYGVSDEDEITDSSWRITITAGDEHYETFDGVDREMMLAVADRIADRSRVPIEWSWMIGRFEDPRPAAQAVVRDPEPHIDWVPDDYERSLGYRLLVFLDALPF